MTDHEVDLPHGTPQPPAYPDLPGHAQSHFVCDARKPPFQPVAVRFPPEPHLAFRSASPEHW